MFWNNDDEANYDYKRLRRDLEDEFGAQGAAFSSGFGFMEMMEVSGASNEELLKMARRERLNLDKYKK